jgi:hypothetical protein
MEKKIISYSLKHLQDSKFQLEILTNDGVTLFQGDITDCQKHINYFIYDNPNAKFGIEPNEVLNLKTMEKKQTAVEWYANASHELIVKKTKGEINHVELLTMHHNLIQQAKQMEKEQIEDAWLNGMKSEMIAPFGINRYRPEANEYYNETYGG